MELHSNFFSYLDGKDTFETWTGPESKFSLPARANFFKSASVTFAGGTNTNGLPVGTA